MPGMMGKGSASTHGHERNKLLREKWLLITRKTSSVCNTGGWVSFSGRPHGEVATHTSRVCHCPQTAGRACCGQVPATVFLLSALWKGSTSSEESESRSWAQITTSSLKTTSVTGEEFHHRVPSAFGKALTAPSAPAPQQIETPWGAPGLREELPGSCVAPLLGTDSRYSLREQATLQKKHQTIFLPVAASPVCHFVKAACFVETNTFWLLFGSVQPAETPS